VKKSTTFQTFYQISQTLVFNPLNLLPYYRVLLYHIQDWIKRLKFFLQSLQHCKKKKTIKNKNKINIASNSTSSLKPHSRVLLFDSGKVIILLNLIFFFKELKITNKGTILNKE